MFKLSLLLFLILISFSTFAQLKLSDYRSAEVSGTSNTSPSQAPVVFLDQAPNGVNGLFADSSCAGCGTTQQTVAENFTVAVAGPSYGITEIVIWGGYFPENIPNVTDDFSIIIRSDAAGSPGTILNYMSDLQASSRVSTGVILFGVNEYIFTFDLSTSPVLITNAGTYWIEIYNNSTSSSNFFWETGNVDATHGIAGSGWTTATPGLTWNLDPATDLSVQINGSDAVPVELMSFAATISKTNVTLNWVTATETNNHGFEVQRSLNGIDFETLSYVQGNGTTTETKFYSYQDKKVAYGSYNYRLKQIDFDGTSVYSNQVAVDINAPKEFALDQNYPNPFNPNTNINFRLETDSKVTLKVFDVLGQEIITLINGNLAAGGHEVNFDAGGLNSGVYFYRIEAVGDNGTNFIDVKKMILNK